MRRFSAVVDPLAARQPQTVRIPRRSYHHYALRGGWGASPRTATKTCRTKTWRTTTRRTTTRRTTTRRTTTRRTRSPTIIGHQRDASRSHGVERRNACVRNVTHLGRCRASFGTGVQGARQTRRCRVSLLLKNPSAKWIAIPGARVHPAQRWINRAREARRCPVPRDHKGGPVSGRDGHLQDPGRSVGLEMAGQPMAAGPHSRPVRACSPEVAFLLSRRRSATHARASVGIGSGRTNRALPPRLRVSGGKGRGRGVQAGPSAQS